MAGIYSWPHKPDVLFSDEASPAANALNSSLFAAGDAIVAPPVYPKEIMESTKTHLELALRLVLFSRGMNPNRLRQSSKRLSLEELSRFDGATYDQGVVYLDKCICPARCTEEVLTVDIYNGDLEGSGDLCLRLEFKSSDVFELHITPEGAALMARKNRVKILEEFFISITRISAATQISPEKLMASHPKLCKAFSPVLVRAFAPRLYPAFFESKGE